MNHDRLVSAVEGSPLPSVVGVLELTASGGRPELLNFLLETMLNSTMRFAVQGLASDFDVPIEEIGVTIHQACHHLDQLVKMRGHWRDPKTVLQSPNIAALFHVARARGERVSGAARCRRLEAIQRKLERAHERAQTRAWIEAFLGPSLVVKPQEAQGC